ncbi:MAG: hypothetical protein M1423_00710, partial [Acidobacteria bacterium]|nr:hypothetical protein [Acidobacteriota bacterium]
VALWCAFRISMPRGPYEFDHANIVGSFHLLCGMYQRPFFSIATLAFVGAGLAASIKDQEAMSMLVLAGIFALLFNGLMLFFYEGYLHERYANGIPTGRSNYTLNRYATVLALGWSAFALFVVGVVMLAKVAVN